MCKLQSYFLLDILLIHLQPKFDDELENCMSEIDQKYPVGLCSDHSNQQCFYHQPTDNHFILDHLKSWCGWKQLQVLVLYSMWKLSIFFFQCKGTATLTSITMGSNLFSTQHAAKKPPKSKSSNVTSDIPTTPISTAPLALIMQPPYSTFHLSLLMATFLSLPTAPFRNRTSFHNLLLWKWAHQTGNSP